MKREVTPRVYSSSRLSFFWMGSRYLRARRCGKVRERWEARGGRCGGAEQSVG